MTRPFRIAVLTLVMLAVAAAQPVLAAAGVVNINTAGVEQLTLLPRVGETVARRIIEFRDANGAFKSAEDLLLVRGVGEKTCELMAPRVVVEGDTTLSEKVATPRASSED
jgi:competence protein ComEA